MSVSPEACVLKDLSEGEPATIFRPGPEEVEAGARSSVEVTSHKHIVQYVP